MITVELEVFKRESLGKQANKKYRKDGFVPAVIYGKNKENLNILIDPIKLKKLLKNEAGENTIIEMKLDKSDLKKNVLLKDAHLDTLTSDPLHLDFYEITDGVDVKVSSPLLFEGKPEGVKNGGVIQTLSNEIKIKCLPTNIPNVIEINISDLNIGDTLRVKDIKPMDGIEILSNPESTIISILAPRLVVETATTDTDESSESVSDDNSEQEKNTEG
ncbi:MAG: 50S ribosomal protein L25 [Thermodesulfobacteriota bacterium]|nr:50S ribosomal protein L25 [bacterium]MEC7925321.1 50S ribosomal protein L25 [Thermodesulfobacteriota bacterium]NSW96139.1 50S ribosomal protein L25 [bacterium]|tara:strand:+ start:341 stop:991 length:651 start_codon:yes stop_codon:yes gene_type:complete